MNVIGYLCWALGFVSVISMIDATNPMDKQTDQQFYDSLSMEDLSKTKRPFCNAFTGCGKKRSFSSENSMENQEQTIDNIRIPVPIYRALLRAASREIRDTIDRESRQEVNDYSHSVRNKIPNGEKYQS